MKESKGDWIEDKCPSCNGTGSVTVARPVPAGFQPKINPPKCPECGGTGRKKEAAN